MKLRITLAAALALSACDTPQPERAQPEVNEVALPEPEPEPEPDPEPLEPDPRGTRWETSATGEGASLILLTPEGERRLTLFCRPRSGGVLVNVPRFRASRGGDTMSLSAGGETVFLDALASADARRGGVSGTMALSDQLSALLRRQEPITVSYGPQTSGPHGPMMPEIASNFVASCRPARQ